MTLTEALAALHRAGRIRSPWLPGMRAILDRGLMGGRTPFRRSDDGLRWTFPSDIELANSIVDRDGEPDRNDPATVGCLLALMREASGSPDAGTSHHHGGKWVAVCRAAWEALPGGRVPDGDIEGDAIAAALVALAVATTTEQAPDADR